LAGFGVLVIWWHFIVDVRTLNFDTTVICSHHLK